MGELGLVQKIAAWAIPVLFAITLHEVAHGWVAKQLGDSTAMMLGRLTVNPLKHIDPIGTVLVPILMLMLTPFVLGWAKPVPVAYRNLKHPKRDMAVVAIAGPIANLLMLLFWALVLQLVVLYHGLVPWMAEPLVYMSVAGIVVNAILMIVNLVPVPPLDGGRILTGLLPRAYAYRFSRIEPYGMLIVIALLVTGVLGKLVSPAIIWFVLLPASFIGIRLDEYHAVLRGLGLF